MVRPRESGAQIGRLARWHPRNEREQGQYRRSRQGLTPTATQLVKQLAPFIREHVEPRHEPLRFWNRIGPDHGNPIASRS